MGSFGPLRKRESESLKKLEKEGKLMAVILSHRHNFDNLQPQHIMPVPHVQVSYMKTTCLIVCYVDTFLYKIVNMQGFKKLDIQYGLV